MYEFLDRVDERWFDISIGVAHKGQYDIAISLGPNSSGCISKVALHSPSQRREICSASKSTERETSVGLTSIKMLASEMKDSNQKMTMTMHVRMSTTSLTYWTAKQHAELSYCKTY